jgi:hypothetical protein
VNKSSLSSATRALVTSLLDLAMIDLAEALGEAVDAGIITGEQRQAIINQQLGGES